MITITAYSKIKKVDAAGTDSIFVYLGQPQSQKNLCKDIEEGMYDYMHAYELVFNVDTYNTFVEDLAKLLGYPKIEDSYREGALYAVSGSLHPIFMITPDNFTVVDTTTSKKVHLALTENMISAVHSLRGDSEYIYTQLHGLFALAADGGCVVFE